MKFGGIISQKCNVIVTALSLEKNIDQMTSLLYHHTILFISIIGIYYSVTSSCFYCDLLSGFFLDSSWFFFMTSKINLFRSLLIHVTIYWSKLSSFTKSWTFSLTATVFTLLPHFFSFLHEEEILAKEENSAKISCCRYWSLNGISYLFLFLKKIFFLV